ncbi:MAG TPA: S-methyl-5'-thioadenosine phosphorylase [Patescibacteria group bacterium]|nr:S-methyl-5'-thioadenosine phosphorylase [Patescibacteria group bacterium]
MKIAIIGGSGLDNPDILQNIQEEEQQTVYGAPSSSLKTGTIGGVEVVLLARHGREHTIPPSQVNFRANISALQACGCTHIIATTAVGSLREDIGRGDFVILDQYLDFTRHRCSTFYEQFKPHQPKHTPMADPFSATLRAALIQSCKELHMPHHETGTVVTIEGPRFSTRAESRMFRQWGADIINMTVATEAALANEAGVPYGCIAMSTDYDCWKEDEQPVSWEDVMHIFSENAQKVTQLLTHTISKIQHHV